MFCKLEEKGMVQFLASFSIQFVITCIMQLRRGEAYVLNKIVSYYVTDQNFMLIGLMIPTCTSVNNDIINVQSSVKGCCAPVCCMQTNVLFWTQGCSYWPRHLLFLWTTLWSMLHWESAGMTFASLPQPSWYAICSYPCIASLVFATFILPLAIASNICLVWC